MNLFCFGARRRTVAGSALALAFLFNFHATCTDTSNNKSNQGSYKDGHFEMLKSIKQIAGKIDVPQNGYAAKVKLAYLDQLMSSSTSQQERLNTVLKKGIVLLEYGDEANAVKMFEKIIQYVGDNPKARVPTLYWLGTAYLRLAERSNCVAGHTADACIMPLQASGIHKDKSPSRKAIETFETFLKESPEDPNYYDGVWLLNIAYMTVGEYPGKVPKKWLLPNLDKPVYSMKPFADMATPLNIMVNSRAGGSIVDDFNNDGFLDLVISGWDLGEDKMYYFQNKGDGTFSNLSESSGLGDFTGGLNIQQTDYNNDGHLDIWVLRGAWQGQSGPYGEQPNSLFRNNGNGTFTDVTLDAGLWSLCPTQASTWNDYNHDGWLDLFIGNENLPASGKTYASQLYINNQNGTFTEVAEAAGANIKMYIKGVTSGDYDNDGWPDLFLSAMDGKKILLRNKAQASKTPSFEDVSAQAGFSKENYRSFPTFFFDYDNDGWLDLFVCNYDFEKSLSYYYARDFLGLSKDDPSGRPYIYHNNGDGTFTNASQSLGLNTAAYSMGANFGDLNNDGFLDFYLGTGNPNYQSVVPNKLYMNVGGKKFMDATVSSRTGNIQKGHGVSIADIDNDGDQDIHVEMGGAYRGDGYPNSMYINPGQNRNNWIYLKVEGSKSNRASIGAKITVKFHENGVPRMVYRELNSGGSFGSNPLRREIGIGTATIIDEIRITWPVSGITQVLTNVEPNQLLHIKEGTDGATKLPLQKLQFSPVASDMPMCAPTK
ncbi:MAG: CRTAC1 family protein [Saprospiraceae bacterium]|nr:CRTAC1 family protein [Saprospiraceae bacterium]